MRTFELLGFRFHIGTGERAAEHDYGAGTDDERDDQGGPSLDEVGPASSPVKRSFIQKREVVRWGSREVVTARGDLECIRVALPPMARHAEKDNTTKSHPFPTGFLAPSGGDAYNGDSCGRGSVVEHHLAKVRVASSNLVARSDKTPW